MMKRKYLPMAFLLALTACGGAAYDQGAEADDTLIEDGQSKRCDLTEREELPGECARLQEQYDDLVAGRDAFNPSQAVREYEPTVITYSITRLPDEVQGEGGELVEAITEEEQAEGAEGLTQEEIDAVVEQTEQDLAEVVEPGPDSDEVVVRPIKLGRMMQACLEGDPSIEIEEAACQTLDTLEKPIATWRWTITPTKPGNFTLQVQSKVELTASDGSPRLIRQGYKNARIAVEVTPYGRWKRFLDAAERWVRSPLGLLAALTLLVGAIGTLIGAIKRARRGEGPAPPQDNPPEPLDASEPPEAG